MIFTLDIETDCDGELLDIGFYDGEKVKFFQSWKIFLSYTENYKGIVYAHNGGNFDYVGLCFWLYKNGKKFTAAMKSGRILKLQIENYNLIFQDSFTLIPLSLESMTTIFSEIKKIKISEKKYADMRKFKLSEKDNYYSYLEADVKGLYESLQNFKKLFSEFYELETLPITIGKLSMEAFKNKFCKEKIIYPTRSENEFTKQSYFGGRVEFIGDGIYDGNKFKNVNAYDVNSMYPFQMLQNAYPTYRGIHSSNFKRKNGKLQSGIYKIKWIQKRGKIPILQALINGKFEYVFEGSGFATHFEIEKLFDLGIVKCLGGYVYEKTSKIFSEFVNVLYDLKLRAKEFGDLGKELIYKLLLNNLYGKFGQKNCFEELKVFNLKERDYAMQKGFKLREIHLTNETDTSIYTVLSEKKYFNSFVAISSMITAAARMKLTSDLELLKTPIYCDTDSIHTQDKMKTGNKLGDYKLEYSNCDINYFGKKSYEILGKKFVQKGIPTKKLSHEIFDELDREYEVCIKYQSPYKIKSAIREKISNPNKFHERTRKIKKEDSSLLTGRIRT